MLFHPIDQKTRSPNYNLAFIQTKRMKPGGVTLDFILFYYMSITSSTGQWSEPGISERMAASRIWGEIRLDTRK